LKSLTSRDFQQFINALLPLVCINKFFKIPVEIQQAGRTSVVLALLSIRCFVIQGSCFVLLIFLHVAFGTCTSNSNEDRCKQNGVLQLGIHGVYDLN
jgi:hypothetical protein